MDILTRLQSDADINIVVPLVINTGAPDTGATLTIKAIKPDGTEHTTFTQPTITEVIAASGVYLLVFPSAAATKLFTLADQNNPYTLLVKTATSGSTGYRAIRVYPTTNLPGDVAKEATALLNAKYTLNKKEIKASTGVYSLHIYDDDGTTPIVSKVLKDINGTDITAPAAGVIAREAASVI